MSNHRSAKDIIRHYSQVAAGKERKAVRAELRRQAFLALREAIHLELAEKQLVVCTFGMIWIATIATIALAYTWWLV